MPRRLAYEFVKSKFKKEGCTLLSKYYKNAQQKLDYICPNGHVHSIRWRSFKEGKRCFSCFGKPKKTIEFVREKFEEESYTLLTTVYEGYKQKLKYRCSEGHVHRTTWRHFQQGRRCPTCYLINCFGENTPNWKGGVCHNSYCHIWRDKEYKKSIRERDGNKCLNPMCNGKISQLSVHHIDYDKNNCGPRNLITVCASCNTKANKDREWHKSWYNAIMHNRYGYVY